MKLTCHVVFFVVAVCVWFAFHIPSDAYGWGCRAVFFANCYVFAWIGSMQGELKRDFACAILVFAALLAALSFTGVLEQPLFL